VYVFLIGTGRCGSTLVHELLACHPGVGFISNLEDRVPGMPPIARRSANALYREAPAWLRGTKGFRYAPSEAYQALAREVSSTITEPSRDLLAADAIPWLAGRFQAFFATRASAARTPVFPPQVHGVAARRVHRGGPARGAVHQRRPRRSRSGRFRAEDAVVARASRP
jgi:hypothetical protein